MLRCVRTDGGRKLVETTKHTPGAITEPMRVTTILLADYASGGNISKQKLSVNGVFNAINPPTLPFEMTGFRFIWLVEMKRGDIAPTYRAAITDPSGEEILSIVGEPDNPKPEKRFGVTTMNLAIERVMFTKPGIHDVVVRATSIDGQSSEHEISLMVNKPKSR